MAEAGTVELELDAQYRALREEAGVVVITDGVVIDVEGAEGAELLQGQLTNDVEALAVGAGCYAALLDRKGKMRSDMRVLRTGEETIRVEVPSAAAEQVERHLTTYKVGREVQLRHTEPATVRLVGPRTIELLDSNPIGPEHSSQARRIAEQDCLAVATAGGADLVAEDREAAEAIAAELEGRGAAPVSVEALEILRVEAGVPAFGREMGNETIPQEAGINDRAVSFSKGCYIGQETVARLHYRGKPNRHLRRLVAEREIPAGGELTLEGKALGRVGTAVVSPARGPLGLAILRREAEPGTSVSVDSAVEALVEAIE